MESYDLGAFNDGSNVEIRHFWADIGAYEVAGIPGPINPIKIPIPDLLRFPQKCCCRAEFSSYEIDSTCVGNL